MAGERTEKVVLKVSVSAKAGLDRLARYYQVSKEEVFERLVTQADLDAADKAFKSGGAKGEKAYYDGPQP